MALQVLFQSTALRCCFVVESAQPELAEEGQGEPIRQEQCIMSTMWKRSYKRRQDVCILYLIGTDSYSNLRNVHLSVESNSRLLWFCLTTLYDWLKKLAPLPQPIRGKTKANCDLLARVFPRFAPVNYFELVYDTQLKTAV